MHQRRAGLPLILDQASSVVQSSLTFVESQAGTGEDSTNHAALQACHGQSLCELLQCLDKDEAYVRTMRI